MAEMGGNEEECGLRERGAKGPKNNDNIGVKGGR